MPERIIRPGRPTPLPPTPPFDDAHFDGVLSWYSMIHTPGSELPRIVAEFRRIFHRFEVPAHVSGTPRTLLLASK